MTLGVLAFVGGACGGDDGGGDSFGTGSNSATAATMTTAATSESTGASASMTLGSNSGESSTGSSGSTDATGTETSQGGTSSTADSSGGTAADSDTGGVCAGEQESCASGETCCGTLNCCAGVPVPMGQEYCSMQCPDSDRNLKHDFGAVDAEAVLDTLASVPITTWSYRRDDGGVRHIGPMAQDFKAAFGVGESDLAIFQIDADGVALAGVQGLHRRVQALQQENDELREIVAQMQRRLEVLERAR